MTEPVFVKRFLVAETNLACLDGWTHLDSVFGRISESADALAAENGVVLPDRVYITRRDARRQRLANEGEIEAVRHGFVVQEFSSIPLWHQIAIARSARTIMAPQGAGLSYIAFSQPGKTIIELMPIKESAYNLRFNFARLSLLKGHNHIAWLESQNLGDNTWTIDIDEFKGFLRKNLG